MAPEVDRTPSPKKVNNMSIQKARLNGGQCDQTSIICVLRAGKTMILLLSQSVFLLMSMGDRGREMRAYPNACNKLNMETYYAVVGLDNKWM